MVNDWVPLQTLQTPQFQQNLAFLQTMDPELFQLAQRANLGETLLVKSEEGYISCRRANEEDWIFGKNPEQELGNIQNEIEQIPQETGLLILAGTAIGYTLALAVPELLKNPERRILVLEKSAARIHAFLSFVLLQQAFDTGRIHACLSDYSINSILQSIRRFALENCGPLHLFRSPETKIHFKQSELDQAYSQLGVEALQRKQALIEFIAQNQETMIPRTVRNALLIDCWPDSPGQVHILAIQQALQYRGIKTHILPLQRYRMDRYAYEHRRILRPRLMQILESFQPDLVISYGYHGHYFLDEDLFERGGFIPLQVVSNIGYYDTQYYPSENTALCESHLIPYFQFRGTPNPFFVPLMADYIAARPVQTDRRFPIVFVGNSLALPMQEYEKIFEKYAQRTQLIEYMKQARVDFGEYDSKMNLYAYMENHAPPQIENERERYEIFRYLLCIGSSLRRVQLLESIADLGLTIFGGDWGNILTPDSPLRACVKGHLAIQEESKVFSLGHIFVNIQSVGHVTGPNMRFFNVPGMGGFQITDGDFSNYLQANREAVYFSSGQEFREKVEHYLHHLNEVDTIRQKSQDRIRRDWTYHNWVSQVFEHLSLKTS